MNAVLSSVLLLFIHSSVFAHSSFLSAVCLAVLWMCESCLVFFLLGSTGEITCRPFKIFVFATKTHFYFFLFFFFSCFSFASSFIVGHTLLRSIVNLLMRRINFFHPLLNRKWSIRFVRLCCAFILLFLLLLFGKDIFCMTAKWEKLKWCRSVHFNFSLRLCSGLEAIENWSATDELHAIKIR